MDMETGAGPEQFEFTSVDGETAIHVYAWQPEGEMKGVVQIVHGMAEHATRYDGFARFLTAHGYAVYAHDQIGHGLSADPEMRGQLPARRGKRIMVGDVGKLRGIISTRIGASVPHFVFGHSLGSFITRCYIAHEGTGLSGAIICGTGTVGRALAHAGNAAARLISRVRGEDYVSSTLESMGVGAYASAIKDADSELDWLSYSQANIESYRDDELSGFPFSAGGYATVTALAGEACNPKTAKHIPDDLPLLFIAGEGDPVGDFGRGVRKAAETAMATGSRDVSLKVYEGMRHEILNEEHADMVMDDILAWIEARTRN